MNLTTKQRILLSILMIVIFIACLIGMLYPVISARHNEKVQSQLSSQYKEHSDSLDNTQLNQLLESAAAYNRKLYLGEIIVNTPEGVEASGYFNELVMDNTDIMAIVRIPAIQVEMPVYHGIGNDALSRGVGHMPQSSLPIGGENTHSVLSAHTGMASNPMFSDLATVQIGDLFYIDILGMTLTYQVYNIETVLPQYIDSIQIQQGEDLCTLLTCTPIGVNSHRLLVHGERVQESTESNAPASALPQGEVIRESLWETTFWRNWGIGILAIILTILLSVTLSIRRLRKQK